MIDVANWLRSHELDRFIDLFAENEIDGEVLADLTDDDLKELGLTIGARKKLLKAIATLSTGATTASPGGPVTESVADSTATTIAERRQLTVLFCDLVGSTALSATLDPEEMRELIRDYQDTCAGVIARFEGFIAKFMGDGVLVYFGYPRAHEDDAERAVRAGLALTEAVARQKSPSNEPLAARVGISTGVVVVGDRIGEGPSQEQAVVGETPNLAARLQSLARPGAVVIGDSTRQILGALFHLKDGGLHAVRGFPGPVRTWQVLGEGRAVGRFEAQHAGGPAHLVGRDQELALLLDRWELAKSGEGQAVLLSGEAGIGKSRLTEALRERIDMEPHSRLRYFCSPYHTSSALYPVIDQLERAADFDREDGNEQKLDKLEKLLGESTNEASDLAPLFSALLSLDAAGRYPPLDLTPQAQKARTFEALLSQLDDLAAHKPVLMILEDAHWLDPTTVELFDLAVDHLQQLPVFLIVTFRPGFLTPWTGFTHVTALSLNRLSQRQGAAIVERISGGKPLPKEVVEQILAKTDGVPLFVEELTKMVLESGLLDDAGGHYVLKGPLPALAIPSTLRDSLMARLDRLAPAKEVAQIGAVIGREFEYELISLVSPMPEDELRHALDQLAGSELVFCRGHPPQAIYRFKHALVQDTAYQSLLKSRLRQLHARIAEVLKRHFPDIARARPELLAHHYTEAGIIDEAVLYWRLAGEQAARRASVQEAVQHFQTALELLASQPEGRARDSDELKVLVQFGPALLLAQGWASAEVGIMYRRARELAIGLEDPARLVPPLVGLWIHYQGTAQFDAADETTSALFQVARSLEDADLLLQAHHAAWPTPMLRGEFASAYEHVEAGLRLYDCERHGQHAFLYMGHDPGVCAHALGSVIAWNLGHADRADRHAGDALDLARRVGHPPTLALALWFVAFAYAARGDSASALSIAHELLHLGNEQQLIQSCASAQIIGGWAVAQQGQTREGTGQLQSGLAIWNRMGARHYLPAYTCLLAEGYFLAQRYEDALSHLSQALAYCEETGERGWKSRIHRTRGQVLLHRSSRGLESAEESFKTALEVGRAQGAKSLELRAATDLARLYCEQGKRCEARRLLEPICNWFTEGFCTPDFKEARTLLEDLA